MIQRRPRIEVQPDFQRFKDVLLLKRAVKRPPLFDFHVAPNHKEAVLGRPCVTARDDVEFFSRAGYDFAQVTVYAQCTELQQAIEKQQAEQDTASHHVERIIGSLEQFKAQRWSWQALAEGDLSRVQGQFDRLEEVAAELPNEMKILLHTADVFTFAWEMMGFDELCVASLEEPEFVEAVMGSLSEATINVLKRAIEVGGEKIGMLFYSDDIAYTEGLMLSPEFYRRFLFPTMKQIADLGKRIGAPMIYHSDGRLFPVFDDLAAVGVRGIQPLEPKSMDPLEIKQRWPGKFCLLGNIDLDLMVRGTPEQVAAHTREKIDRLNAGGGYMPGVSNTVPDYVSTENWLTMIETVYNYRD